MFEPIIEHLSIEILSPVHIGSGNMLKKGEDFFVQNEKATVISLDELINFYRSDKFNLSRISEILENGGDLTEFYNRTKNQLKNTYSITSALHPAFEVREFYKDPFYNPIVPGASLKGSMRTIILWESILKEKEIKKKYLQKINERNFQIEAIVFGRDAKKDPFKAVSIEDVPFKPDNLSIYNAKIFDIKRYPGYGWKKTGRNSQIMDSIEEGTTISFEALQPQSRANFTLTVDSFSVNNFEKNSFKTLFGNFWGNFCKISKEYSRVTIEKEINFLDKTNSKGELNSIIAFLRRILKEVSALDENSAVFRMAYGIGWQGMTGDYFDSEELKRIRSVKKLGSNYSDIFPKTRRLIVDRNSSYNLQPVFPLGWVKIRRT